jgi:uncharacterized membrane protein YozB (DUF420 family)
MWRKLTLLLLSLFLFYVSVNGFKEIAETGCIRGKFGYMLCDWTKYVWAASGSIFALLCIWSAFRSSEKNAGKTRQKV